MSSILPTEIARYQVVRRLGQGGMGTLYLASDPAIGRFVAIKLIREGADNPELRERFTREAHFVGRLRHINIVTIFDVGEYAGEPYIAMEYIEGETLGDLIKRGTALPVVRKIELMEGLCAGLHYAHKAGVIHRDVKPANLMIDRDGTVKILDFGIARLGLPGMTQSGMVIGTLNYMAPEQMAGRDIDGRADMFSVGAVFYELLSYRRAFPGNSWQDGVLHRIMSGEVEPLEALCPALDSSVIAIVKRCLEKDAADRYPDLAAVGRELAAVRQRLPPEAPIGGESTIAIHPLPAIRGNVSPARTPTPTPSASSEQLLRAQQVQTLVERARRAIEDAEFDAAVTACRQALLIDPENIDALRLKERARNTLDERQIQQWLADGRRELERGELDSASQIVERALGLDSASAPAIAFQQAVDHARLLKATQDPTILLPSMTATIAASDRLAPAAATLWTPRPTPGRGTSSSGPEPSAHGERTSKLVLLGGVAAILIFIILGLVFDRFKGVDRVAERPPENPPVSAAPVAPSSDELSRQRLAEVRTLVERGEADNASKALDQILATDPTNQDAIELRARVTEIKATPPPTVTENKAAAPSPRPPAAPAVPSQAPAASEPKLVAPPPAKRPTPPPAAAQPTAAPQPHTRGSDALAAGDTLENAGDLAGALRQYERARQLDPSLASSADQSAQRVVARMKADSLDAMKRARQYDALNRVAEAITWYERAYRNLPDDDPSKKTVKDRLDVLRARR